MICLRYCWSKYVCFSCFWIFLSELSLDTYQKISWKFCKDQTWFSWDIVNLRNCLFVFLLVCIFLFFIWIILGYPYEEFIKVLYRSILIKMRYCLSKNFYLFVCLFVCFLFCHLNYLCPVSLSFFVGPHCAEVLYPPDQRTVPPVLSSRIMLVLGGSCPKTPSSS